MARKEVQMTPRCPSCRRPMNDQYDTEAEEPFWWCEHCDLTFEIGGQDETVYMTSVVERGA